MNCAATTSTVELLEVLLGCRSAVVLSGYASPLYDDLLCTWSRRVISFPDRQRRHRPGA